MVRPQRLLGLALAGAAAVIVSQCGDEPASPPVDTTRPTVHILSPADGAEFGANLDCSAAATDDHGVTGVTFGIYPIRTGGTFSDSSVAHSPVLSAPPYLFTWNATGAALGSYGVVVEARDAAGNAASDTALATHQDVEGPQVTIETPANDAPVGGLVPVRVTAIDPSPITSVYLRMQVPQGPVIRDSLFLAPPYAMTWDARYLPFAPFEVCAEAQDSAGNTSDLCHTVHVYPAFKLQYDDGQRNDRRGFQNNSYQLATIFQNPYDVAVRVDTLEFFIDVFDTSLGAPFRFVLWGVSNGRPSLEVEGTPVLAVRDPRGTYGYYSGWSTIVPPHGYIAAGIQQVGTDPVSIGVDTDSKFVEGRHFLTSPAGARNWVDLGQLGDPVVPLIHLYGSIFTGHSGRLKPVGAGSPRQYGTRDAPTSSAGAVSFGTSPSPR